MADDKTKVGKPDRKRINPYEDYEFRHWAQKFGVQADAWQVHQPPPYISQPCAYSR